MKKRIVVGITGSFGSGKTAVARMFKQMGAKVIDADKIAHQLIRPKTKVYDKILSVFGKDILTTKQTRIDRTKLARLVFDNRDLLNKLNKIMHPEIIKIIKKRINKISEGIVVLDAPLLIEAGLKGMVDRLVVVDIKPKVQIQRLLKRNSLKQSDIIKRIRAQIPLSDKIRQADFVIDNSGSIKQTKKQFKKIWRLLWKDWISEN